MEPINFNYDKYKHHELKINKYIYQKKGLCGLINNGNTCFMNSILQCLFHTLKLTDYILTGDYKNDLDKKNNIEFYVLHSYVTLINNVWDENQLIKPRTFLENIAKIHRKYFSLQQQDSHECLLYILELLHKPISYEIEVEIKGEIKNHADILMKKSLENWAKFYETNYSYIIELFNGSLVNNINCINCKYKDEIFEPYNNLILNIPEDSTSTISLEECLNLYFNERNEIVDTWKCEKCNNNGCSKSIDLWALPVYIIINLKRFKTIEENSMKTRVKNTNLITFPLNELNLTKYLSKEKNDTNNYIYDCYAINYHSGDLNNGHYWSACKNIDNSWFKFNDGNVEKYNETYINSQLITNDAYILFYERRMILKKIKGKIIEDIPKPLII